MTYETAMLFAKTWGLIGMVVMFVIVLTYALWPNNKDKFDKAAHIPLNED